jgi:hypothetical protein
MEVTATTTAEMEVTATTTAETEATRDERRGIFLPFFIYTFKVFFINRFGLYCPEI